MEETGMQEQIDKIKEETKEINNTDQIAELIKNNAIEFNYEGIRYRVTKPSFAQKQEVNDQRIKKYVQLLKDTDKLLEKDLIEIYKKRGIDILELDNTYDALSVKRKDLSARLGKAIVENKSQPELDAFKKEIDSIASEMQELMVRKTVYLDSSLESQLNIYVYTYLAYVLAEKETRPAEGQVVWVKAWESYDQFLNEKETLVNLTVWYATLVGRNEVPFS